MKYIIHQRVYIYNLAKEIECYLRYQITLLPSLQGFTLLLPTSLNFMVCLPQMFFLAVSYAENRGLVPLFWTVNIGLILYIFCDLLFWLNIIYLYFICFSCWIVFCCIMTPQFIYSLNYDWYLTYPLTYPWINYE